MRAPAHEEALAAVYVGDCVEVMAEMSECSIDAIVCDPPYGLEFMGKEWDKLDAGLPQENVWKGRHGNGGWAYETPEGPPSGMVRMQRWHHAWALAAYRVLKPGGHLVAFGGTRTFHRLTCALEDAGFEIRDCLMWLYGSGFPKSLDVSKAIDKAAGAERPRVPGGQGGTNTILGERKSGEAISGEAISGEAITWQGWGTALKPAWEPIILARKPLGEQNVAANVLKHGTGAVNVDGCRIGTADRWEPSGKQSPPSVALSGGADGSLNVSMSETHPLGRWPANVLLDEAAAAMLDAQSGERDASHDQRPTHSSNAAFGGGRNGGVGYRDTGGASRFFYTAKADAEDRDGSKHPTVKPVDLMKWLLKLVTPPGGVVLDPFLGSGTTVYAARALGVRSVGIEREAEYAADAIRRLRQGVLF